MPFDFDHTPIPSDWDDPVALFQDMAEFARTYPDAEFLCADHPPVGSPPSAPRLGWSAFVVDKEGAEVVCKLWTITLLKYQQSGYQNTSGNVFFRTSQSRQAHLNTLVDEARGVVE